MPSKDAVPIEPNELVSPGLGSGGPGASEERGAGIGRGTATVGNAEEKDEGPMSVFSSGFDTVREWMAGADRGGSGSADEGTESAGEPHGLSKSIDGTVGRVFVVAHGFNAVAVFVE